MTGNRPPEATSPATSASPKADHYDARLKRLLAELTPDEVDQVEAMVLQRLAAQRVAGRGLLLNPQTEGREE